MTSLKQIQTPEQKIQETEKKIKNMKRLENVLIGGAVLGAGTAITGLKFDNEICSAIVSLTGLGVGASSAIAGFYTILDRQVLDEYLKDYKKNNFSKDKSEDSYK